MTSSTPARTPQVVIFGNSAGGQFVNRYAAVGRGPGALAARGIQTRFIVANPSTYLYFGDDRPHAAPGRSAVNQWRYGFDGANPEPGVRLIFRPSCELFAMTPATPTDQS